MHTIQSHVLWAYIPAVIILVALPGPNIVLILHDSIRHGLKKSLLTISGIKAAGVLVFAVTLSGLVAILSMGAWVFTLVKWAGVCYLIWLGVSQILGSTNARADHPEEKKNANSFFIKGFLVCVTNPKGLLFAGAFFPQFIENTRPMASQALSLAALFILVSGVIEVLYALAGNTLSRFLDHQRFQGLTARLSGITLVLFGVGLAFVHQK